MNTDCGARSASAYGGFYGEFRLMHRASWQRVQSKEGTDLIFDNPFEAEAIAWRVFHARMYPLVRGESVLSTAKSAAERLFKKIPGQQLADDA
jgi:hypothetical protein